MDDDAKLTFGGSAKPPGKYTASLYNSAEYRAALAGFLAQFETDDDKAAALLDLRSGRRRGGVTEDGAALPWVRDLFGR
jgi:hypothetical protein